VVVVTLVGLAGCSGNGGTTTLGDADGAPTTVDTTANGQDSTAETTTMRTPTTGEQTTDADAGDGTTPTTDADAGDGTTPTTDGSVRLPPGTDRTGITDEEALLAAFGSVASETDYRLSGTYDDVTSSGENPTESRRIRVAVRASDADARLSVVQRQQQTVGNISANRTQVIYLANSTVYARTVDRGNLSYEVNADVPFEQPQGRAVRAVLNRPAIQLFSWNWTVAGTTTVDGREVVQFSLAGLGEQAESVEVPEANGTALIDSRGVIHRLDVDVRVVDPSEARRNVSLTHEFDPTGTVSVEQPDWLDEARNTTGE